MKKGGNTCRLGRVEPCGTSVSRSSNVVKLKLYSQSGTSARPVCPRALSLVSFNAYKTAVAPSSGRNTPAITGTLDTGGGQGNLNQRLADCLDSRPTYTCLHFLWVCTPAAVAFVPVSSSHYLGPVSGTAGAATRLRLRFSSGQALL